MSMVTQYIALVKQSQQEIKQQISVLQSYLEELQKIQSNTISVMQGSTRKEEDEMLSQLTRTRKVVQETIQQLRNANRMLDQVRSI